MGERKLREAFAPQSASQFGEAKLCKNYAKRLLRDMYVFRQSRLAKPIIAKQTLRVSFLQLNMITTQKMLEARVHFGHKVQNWNPKMAPYIFGERNGVHVIDLIQTKIYLDYVCKFLAKKKHKNARILFVCTKEHMSTTIADVARQCSSNYVNNRWLGGLLTNWNTMEKSMRKLRQLEYREKKHLLDKLPKKEIALLRKRKEKLEKYFGGMKNMYQLPHLVILIGQQRETSAVLECQKLNIPIITILDTNCDPSLTNLFIPANDDSIKSISLILNELGRAINCARLS